MGDVEVGKCDCCKEENVSLERVYYHFPIPCDCCNNSHFEIKRFCKKCIDKADEFRPRTIHMVVDSHRCSTAVNYIKWLIEASYENELLSAEDKVELAKTILIGGPAIEPNEEIINQGGTEND